MPTSQVDIVNKALVYINVSGISAMTESTESAEKASAIYDSTLDEVLRDHAWGFATVIETLAELSDETPTGGGWAYLYAYPSQAVKIRKLYSETGSTHPESVEYREMRSPTTGTRSLATNITPAYCEYTYRVTDPNGYDPKFIEALSLKLAAVLSRTLTGNEGLVNDLLQKYLSSVSEAKRQDLNERKVDTTTDRVSSYVSARG
jgi:hypothetical protein